MALDERFKQWLRPIRRAVVATGQQVAGTLSASHHRRLPQRLVMTLLARDEADIVAATIEHAFSIGIDFIVATDNGSTDGTTEILRDYQRTGRLELLEEPSHTYEQARWVTAMARRAATHHGANWVVNLDADEFLWTVDERPDLRMALAACETSAGLFSIVERRFATDSTRSGGWLDRLVASGTGSSWSGYPFWKVCHRADPAVRVLQGNHFAYGPRLGGLSRRPSLIAMHFPDRSLRQYLHKLELADAAFSAHPNPGSELGRGIRNEVKLLRDGDFETHYARRGRDVASLLGSGALTIDTRLRDHLHALMPEAVLPQRLAEALTR